MARIKLSLDDIGFISLFEKVTKANVKDCIFNQEKNKLTFVVSEGQAGLAIGKGGQNIRNLEEQLKKRVEVLEFSEDPVKFLANIFRPIKINSAYVSEKSSGAKALHAQITKDAANMGMAKAKMKTARELLEKYFHFDEINIQ
ncbi:MAG: NusA-like transcription termination signal-binding factor [Candidatus Nanoarchaeia archaeon]|nr:NusA-like transcription termination signal-binding factor [Candidatus Paceibacterota bacterium]MDD5238865.1 NusA-like transcription termination signal-binding factor [Candidatus Nanoarchaeia archaeon]